MFPRIPRFLELCRFVTILGCNTACNIANLRPAVFGAFSATNCLQTSNPFLFGTRCTNLKLRPVVSVANKAYSVWLNVRMSTEDSSVPAGTFQNSEALERQRFVQRCDCMDGQRNDL